MAQKDEPKLYRRISFLFGTVPLSTPVTLFFIHQAARVRSSQSFYSYSEINVSFTILGTICQFHFNTNRLLILVLIVVVVVLLISMR